MTALTFDTHAAFKVMRDAGVSEPLAESILAVLQMSKSQGSKVLASKPRRGAPATKTDLEDPVTRADLDLLELRMTMRLGLTALVAIVLAIVAAKLL